MKFTLYRGKVRGMNSSEVLWTCLHSCEWWRVCCEAVVFFCHRWFTNLRNGHHLTVYRLRHVHLWTPPHFPQRRAETRSSIKIIQSHFLWHLQRVQDTALSRCWDTTITRGCCIAIASVTNSYLDGWEIGEDKDVGCREPGEKWKEKLTVYPGNSKSPNPASLTAVVKSALCVTDT